MEYVRLCILIVAVLAVPISLGLIATGFEILLESGVPQILIQRVVGVGACIAGVLVAGIVIIDCRRAFRNVLWGET